MQTPTPTSFLARIVLHYTEDSNEYAQFRTLMNGLGFLKSIHRPNEYGVNRHYSLPGGTFFFDATHPLNQFKGFITLEECYTHINSAVESLMRGKGSKEKAANTPASVFVATTGNNLKFSGLQIPLVRRGISWKQKTVKLARYITPPPFISVPGNELNLLARIVLHRLDRHDSYEGFHDIMTDLGFTKYITGFDTRTQQRVFHELPNGLYYFDAAVQRSKSRVHTLKSAYEAVSAAVVAATKDEATYVQDSNNPPSVVVVMADRAAWNGLPVAAPTPAA